MASAWRHDNGNSAKIILALLKSRIPKVGILVCRNFRIYSRNSRIPRIKIPPNPKTQIKQENSRLWEF